MCPLATSMFMTTILLWTLNGVLLPVVIKPNVAKEALQWRSERRAQVQSYANQTKLKSELNIQCN